MSHPDSGASNTSPTIVIVNARVWTRDERRPWADAVLVRGDVIVAVGSSAELRKRAGNGASVIDAEGRMVIPLDPNGRLATNEPADLAIVDRVAYDGAPATTDAAAVIFSLEKGRVVTRSRVHGPDVTQWAVRRST